MLQGPLVPVQTPSVLRGPVCISELHLAHWCAHTGSDKSALQANACTLVWVCSDAQRTPESHV